MLEIEQRADGTMALAGRLDAAQAPKMQAALDALSGATRLDCARLEYVSSAGLGVLLRTQKRLMGSSGRLRLAGVRPHVRDIFVYSISLQPELETPAILKDYAQQWDVRPGWSFLTGRDADIEALRRALGFASSNPAYDRVLDNHTGLVRYGNDRLDRWGGVPGLARAAWIAKAVSALATTA